MNRTAVAAVVGAFLLALWVAVVVALGHLERVARDEAAAMRGNLARTLAESMASSVRAIDIALVNLRKGWLRDPASFDALVQLQESLLRKEKVIQVAVIDRDSWLRYSRLPQSGPVNFADRDYVAFHRDGDGDELHLSTPVFGRVTRQWAIQVTRAIRDAQGRYDGLIVMAIPPPALERLYQDIDLGENGIVTLARSDGRILARSAGFERSVDVVLAAPRDSQGGEFRGSGKVDGIERFVTYRNVADYPLRIYVGQDVRTVLAPYRQERLVLLLLATAASLLVIAIAIVLHMRARERARYADERDRMALELHDGCIQSIYAVGLNLQDSRAGLDADPKSVDYAIAQALADLNLVMQDLRAFIGGEGAPELSAADFVSEVRRTVPRSRALDLALDIDGPLFEALDRDRRSHLLRIAREAVSNVVRHADAAACRVSLHRFGNREVRLEVEDDGRGIGASPVSRASLGLAHIHARARRMGGSASVGARAPGGTQVLVQFPLEAA